MAAPGAPSIDDRRSHGETDRRAGFERRSRPTGRAEGERRTGRDRRLGSRRLRDGHAAEIDLVGAARRARENADAAYSKFKVGAALETADGTIVTGCNIENATYGLTVCAERVAMFKALSDGHRAFTRIAVVADTEAPTPPCGACRQILWEFGGNLEVILANLADEKRHAPAEGPAAAALRRSPAVAAASAERNLQFTIGNLQFVALRVTCSVRASHPTNSSS